MSDAKLGIGPKGERGERGHRGHEGPTGPTGPAASASTPGSWLKFSGTTTASVAAPSSSFLADSGSDGPINAFPNNYPAPTDRSLVNMATNEPLFVPPGGLVTFTLLKNGVAVPGFSITYTSGEFGVKLVTAGPEPFAAGDTFDVRIDTSGFDQTSLNVSAAVGIE